MVEQLESALEELNTLFSQHPHEVRFPSKGTPLNRACDIIGQAMELPFTPPSEATESLDDICSASGVRYRNVVLDHNWWQKDRGPLLGFLKDTQDPIALVCDKKKQYFIVNPVTRERTPLDAKNAQTLFPLAAMFYHPLPETKISFFNLFRFALRGIQREYFSLIVIGIVTTFLSFFFPFANKVLFDQVIPNFNFSLYTQVVLGLIMVTASAAVFNFTRSMIILRLNGIIGHRVQMALWDRLLKLPVQFFRTIASGDLIQRTFIVEVLRRQIGTSTLNILLSSIFSLLYIVMMVYYSLILTAIGVGIALVSIAITAVVLTIKIRYDKQILASEADINAFLIQAIHGITKIRAAAAEEEVFAKWAHDFAHNQRLQLSSLNLGNILRSINATLGVLSPLLIFGAMIWMMVASTTEISGPILPMSIGTFLAFSAASGPFSQSIFSISNSILSFITLIPFWERVRPIFQSETETTKEKTIVSLQGNIRIENLSFRYETNSPLVLEGIDLEVKAGEFVGIVGPSGSGKSTLLRLLIGFETPEKGTLYFDGHELSSLDPIHHRDQIGTILQNSKIFFGSVYDNIVCGGRYSPEQVQQAIQFSTFDRDLEQLPMGLDTILTSGGGTLSGGQRQRLLLARALVSQPKILLLDEATSSLDNRSEDTVKNNLEKLEITRVVIAHRLHTIRHADRIYIVEKGKIVDSGTFEELSDKKSLLSLYEKKQKL